MKTKKEAVSRLNSTFAFAGLILVIIGCLANIYSASANVRFIHDPIDLIYYFRYIILLGGGFAAGYLLTKKTTKYSRHYAGVIYAALTMSIYWLLDFARIGIQNSFTELTYPLTKIVFIGMPLVAFVFVVLVAYLTQRRPQRSDVSAFSKSAIIISFVVYQLYNLVASSYSLMLDLADRSSDTFVWMTAIAYLTSPIVITIISYFLLTSVKRHINNLFYATVAGIFYATLTSVLWEFRTDASYASTTMFSAVITIVAVVFIGALLWQARRVSK
jgi:hypothetical protein